MKKKLMLLGAFAAMAPSLAMADGLAAADVVSEITAGKTAVGAVLGAAVAIWGVFILAKLLKRGASKV